MGKSRSDRRRDCGGPQYPLYAAETVLGWRIARYISGAKGEDLLSRGCVRDVYDELGNHHGYQFTSSRRDDSEILSRSSCTSISIREMELNAAAAAFKRDRSRTAGMSEDQRLARTGRFGKRLPPEDATERAVEKVKAWPSLTNAEPGLAVRKVHGESRGNYFPDLSEGAASGEEEVRALTKTERGG